MPAVDAVRGLGSFFVLPMQFDYTDPRWADPRRGKRIEILRRDGFKCRECLRYGRRVTATHVHHVKPAEFFPELAYSNENLVSLCSKCHNKKHPEKGRHRGHRGGSPPTSDL